MESQQQQALEQELTQNQPGREDHILVSERTLQEEGVNAPRLDELSK